MVRTGLFSLMLNVFLIGYLSAQTHTGEIAGRVYDARTQEPLLGVNIVVVEKPNIGTTSDIQGRFLIQGLPVGTYSLRISAVNYHPHVVTNVVVVTGRQTPVSAALEEKVLTGEQVTVHAQYFSRSQLMAPVSANAMDRAEVRRAPGAIQDVQRMVQSMPGVASSTDNINELIVRGGAAFENLTIVDHMEIPSINHYSNQFNSAGPINMINADIIEDVQFSSGGFPAQYGDKASSVLNLSVREGNRNTRFASSSGFNMAGLGTLMEGRIAGGRGSYIFSARKSLLEVADKLIGISTISLTAIPRYWDTQAKVVYDLSNSQKLSFNLLYGESLIDIVGDIEEQDKLRANKIDSSSVERIYPFNKQYALGMNLRSLWGKKGFSVATIYTSGANYDVDVNYDFAYRLRDAEGKVLDYKILNSYRAYYNHSFESFVAAKYELFYQPHPRHQWSLGGQIQTTRKWHSNAWIGPDTLRYDLDRDGRFETGPIIIPEGHFKEKLGFGDASKMYAFFSEKFKPTRRWTLQAGLRYDYFTFSQQGGWSPRFSLTYDVVPPMTFLTFSAGRYQQTQPLPLYSDRRKLDYNKHLKNMYADHLVLGLQQYWGEGRKLSLEGYYKRYRQIAVSEDFIYSAIDTFWSDRYLNVGKRRSYGVELYLEQKQLKNYFGTLCLSWSKTQDEDPRQPKLVKYYPSEYDYPVIFTVLGGRVVKGVRDRLDRMPFFIKYPSVILPLSNEMEIGFKFRYQSGRPYTPLTYIHWRQFREGQIKWSSGAWEASDAVHSARYDDYKRLDIQWLSRFYGRGYNINVFIAIQNVLNSKNVFYDNHRSDGTIERIYQYSFFPVGGVEVEF